MHTEGKKGEALSDTTVIYTWALSPHIRDATSEWIFLEALRSGQVRDLRCSSTRGIARRRGGRICIDNEYSRTDYTGPCCSCYECKPPSSGVRLVTVLETDHRSSLNHRAYVPMHCARSF